MDDFIQQDNKYNMDGEVPDIGQHLYNQILANIESASKDYTPREMPTGTRRERRELIRPYASAIHDYATSARTHGSTEYEGYNVLKDMLYDKNDYLTDAYDNLVNTLYTSGIPASMISKQHEGPIEYSPKIAKYGPYNPENPMSPVMWTDVSGKRWVQPNLISSDFGGQGDADLIESYYEKGIPYASSIIGPLGNILQEGSLSNRIRKNYPNLIPYEEYEPKGKNDRAFDAMIEGSR